MAEKSGSFDSAFKDKESPLTEKIGWIRRLQLGDTAERLRVALEICYRESGLLQVKVLEFRENIPPKYFELIQKQFGEIAGLIKQSAQALKRGNLELGWEKYNAAQRVETRIYYEIRSARGRLRDLARGRFENRALSIFTEGNEKLTGWRKAMVNDLLGRVSRGGLKPRQRPNLSEVLQAQQVLSEHHANVYRRLRILNSRVSFLEAIGVLAILAWILVLIFKPYLDRNCGSVYSLHLTLSSLIFGSLGACISGILRLEKGSTQQKIPDQLISFVYTIARPLVGAVSALGVVTFVIAGILDIGSQTPGLYLAAAFLAGFSERFLELGAGKAGQ